VPIEIRSATTDDAAAIQRIYAPIVRETAISFEYEPPSVEEMAERIASSLQTHPYLVAVSGGEVRGYAYASAHAERAAYRHSFNTTVYIAPEARGTGVGRALYAALLPELKRRGFHAAFAGITQPNPASVALHESVGFKPLGIYHECRLVAAVVVSAGPTPSGSARIAPSGLLHGLVAPFALIGSLFYDVRIYAVPNSGSWYDFRLLHRHRGRERGRGAIYRLTGGFLLTDFRLILQPEHALRAGKACDCELADVVPIVWRVLREVR
jgi:L-amino acid N-acyltransferase YncA